MDWQKSAEGIVSDVIIDGREGLNVKGRQETLLSMTKKTQDSMVEIPESKPEGSGRNPRGTGIGVSSVTARGENYCQDKDVLMEAVVEKGNMEKAYKRVVSNKGSAGVDGMEVEELMPYLNSRWEYIKKELLEDKYKPQSVLQVEIPKPDGGVRKLGIPTAVDRLIGQAVYQILEPIFDRGFSESSYGFRCGRNAHQAVERARQYVAEGRRWVIDIDLEKFFDRVNHDILMARVARKVEDKRILRLIRRYLQAGIMIDGLKMDRQEGTPQGSPLSPLLSNIILDELDKELERRGHKFCRYADDCNIYVKSKLAGERVMESVSNFLEKRLKLKINKTKSKIGRPWGIKFLGYSITQESSPRLRVANSSIKRMKGKLREMFHRGRGRNIKKSIGELNEVLRGWMQYFKLSEVKYILEELDGWIRRKLRCIIWRQWKRSYTRAKNLMKLGIDEARAWCSATNGRGAWWNAGASHMNEAYKKSVFNSLGLISLQDLIQIIHKQSRTAVYGTVRTVV